ncbi:restriction endonuclease subunit S [Vibrio sp. EJY3]|uniref:restriction endonuclease subunit S n=1 Tax=Vibrio sp. (strain EJY3) TaxID=1116375 RepID=UPI000243BECC|nr:restriction endonuclease subunit S [Vibrio sp. EJY3]AEX22835.1 restriction modification system DNA specificity subunit [Vibrio sp. EJY3]
MSFELTTLGEIALGSNGAVDGPFGSNLKASSYTESGIPVIRGSNLSLGLDEFKSDEFVYVGDDTYSRLARSECLPQDIIFTKKGTLGQTGFVPQEPYPSYLISSNQMRLRVDPAKANPKYVYYWVSSKKAIDKIRGESEHTGVPKINLDYLKKFPISLPSVSYQNSAVEILDNLNDKIALNTQTSQTLEEMAQAIFKSWFVDFDPVKAKMNGEQPDGMDAATASLFPEKLVESELGLIPEGWDVLPSEKVATVAIGKTPPRKEPQWFSEDSKDVTWISIRDMGNTGTFALDSSEYLTQEAVDKFNVKVIPDNTLILSFKLTVGRVAITHGEMTTNEAIAHYKLSDNARVSTNYLYSYMNQFNFESLGSTSSIAKAVNSKIIKALPVIVPSKEILGSFDSLVKPLFDKIKSNQIENQNLEDLRDTLLPKLLSGEIEL